MRANGLINRTTTVHAGDIHVFVYVAVASNVVFDCLCVSVMHAYMLLQVKTRRRQHAICLGNCVSRRKLKPRIGENDCYGVRAPSILSFSYRRYDTLKLVHGERKGIKYV